MKQYSVPVCYFPSTVYFIDDSKDFLLNFVLQLDEGLAYRLFDSAKEALDGIDKTRYELNQLKSRCANEHPETLSPFKHPAASASLAPLYAEIYHAERFADVSVVVIDYMMPEMTGLEFCRRIGNTSIKKILLTGEADESVANQAFNEGIIDRYVKKPSPDVVEQITKNISELQREYFQTLSERIMEMLPVAMPSFMKERHFNEFFHAHCQNNDIMEYYMIHPEGHFLLLDGDAEPSILLTKKKSSISKDIERAQALKLSPSVQQAISKGEQILLCNSSDSNGYQLFSARRLVVDEPLYYSYLVKPEIEGVANGALFSYHQYMDKLDDEALGSATNAGSI